MLNVVAGSGSCQNYRRAVPPLVCNISLVICSLLNYCEQEYSEPHYVIPGAHIHLLRGVARCIPTVRGSGSKNALM